MKGDIEKMKKIISAMTVGMLVLSLAVLSGCGKKEEAPAPAATAPAQPAAPAPAEPAAPAQPAK